jgi:mRNA interferase RelE/StbE
VADYRVVLKRSAAKDVDGIEPRADRDRISTRIGALANNPRPYGSEKLQGFEATYRIRQGDYRIVYDIDDTTRTVFVIKVRNRKDVYRRGRA